MIFKNNKYKVSYLNKYSTLIDKCDGGVYTKDISKWTRTMLGEDLIKLLNDIKIEADTSSFNSTLKNEKVIYEEHFELFNPDTGENAEIKIKYYKIK